LLSFLFQAFGGGVTNGVGSGHFDPGDMALGTSG